MPCGAESCSVVRATRDGGRTWYPTGRPNAQEFGQPNSAHTVRPATERDGWVFGPGLWVTHDAGIAWTDQSPSNEVVDIRSADGVAWRLERPRDCQAGQSSCVYGVSTSSDFGRSWAPLALQPPIRREQVSLARRGTRDAWIHAYGV